MIARIIRGAIVHRVFVLVAALALAVLGAWSVWHTPLDALPDLSDTQVIIRTEWPGQTPRIVEGAQAICEDLESVRRSRQERQEKNQFGH